MWFLTMNSLGRIEKWQYSVGLRKQGLMWSVGNVYGLIEIYNIPLSDAFHFKRLPEEAMPNCIFDFFFPFAGFFWC